MMTAFRAYLLIISYHISQAGHIHCIFQKKLLETISDSYKAHKIIAAFSSAYSQFRKRQRVCYIFSMLFYFISSLKKMKIGKVSGPEKNAIGMAETESVREGAIAQG